MASGQLGRVVHYLRRMAAPDGSGDLSDGQLLERFADQRDEAAFAVLVQRHGPLVLDVCRRILANTHDAEDAFQATFLVLVRNAAAIHKRESVSSWLYGVAYRVAVRAKVGNTRRRLHERQAPERSPGDPRDDATWRDLRPLLDEEVQRLPEVYRVPFILCYLEGKTNEQAAELLGCPKGTVVSRLARARERLRFRLTRRGVVLSAGGLAAALVQGTTSAAPPAALAQDTVAAALAFANPTAAATVPAAVASLAEGVLRAVLWDRVKTLACACLLVLAVFGLGSAFGFHLPAPEPPGEAPELPPVLERSAQGGAWSDPATWEGGMVPAAGAAVEICPGHRVVYDVDSDRALRSVRISGTLTFAPDRDTRLDAGLIEVQPAEPLAPGDPAGSPPALEVGTAARPIDAGRTALIRLVYFAGTERASCPAIVCRGGRMDFHGNPLKHTWLKLRTTVRAGDDTVPLAEPAPDWRPGDRVVLTGTTRQGKGPNTLRNSIRDDPASEERLVHSANGHCITLDRPLRHEHFADGEYCGEAANLSRNVIIESADPAAGRGHVAYEHGSAGSISYVEFRHLGKPGVSGRASLNYHLAGDGMRGASVNGASIWDSGNHWLDVHGTDYLVVQDCVGYRSSGHGFCLAGGSEVYNVFDHNLAVGACGGQPLPGRPLTFDRNDGAGFWWANSLNSFTRNVACECDEYGFFFQTAGAPDLGPVLSVRQPNGTRRKVDVRTLPFVRFEDNESHCQRRHAFNLGGGARAEETGAGVGPDARHPLVIRDMKTWDVHWAFHPASPCVLVDGLNVYDAEVGLWRPVYENHAYRNVSMTATGREEHQPHGQRPLSGDFPGLLQPASDLPPVTVITETLRQEGGIVVRGVTAGSGSIERVLVNGQPARALARNYARWEVTLAEAGRGQREVRAHAEDAAGTVEKRPHVIFLPANP
jgi:RNA polymerase sigma factor (sigma-70 family)